MTNRLGLDVGFSETGFALLNVDNKKLLSWGRMDHKNIKNGKDVAKRMEKRRKLRSTRRSRKWYRPKRFDNRKNNDVNLGRWLHPTMRSHVAAHLKLIRFLLNNYNIDEISIELGQFDPRLLKEGEPVANWEYQRGKLYGYENSKQYVRERDNYTCQYCGEDGQTIDHVLPQSRYPNLKRELTNMVCACKDCNAEKGNQTAKEFGHPELEEEVDNSSKVNQKSSTGMNYLNTVLLEYLNNDLLYVEREECEKHKDEYAFNSDIKKTFGYITREDRKKIGWPKTHRHDAVTIVSTGGKVSLLPKYLKMRWMGRSRRKVNYEEYREGGEFEKYIKYNNVEVGSEMFNRGDLVEYTDRKGVTYKGFIQSFFKGKKAKITGIEGAVSSEDDKNCALNNMSNNSADRKSFPVVKLSSMNKIAGSPRLRYLLVENSLE